MTLCVHKLASGCILCHPPEKKPFRLCHCGVPSITELNGDYLCRDHANQWVLGERSDPEDYYP